MTDVNFMIDLPFLAGEINNAHRQIERHATGMLWEAKRAGEMLLKAKQTGKQTGEIPHGQFKRWVEANCRCSYRTAAKYMQVAKKAAKKAPKGADLGTFEGGIDAFLDVHAGNRRPEPSQDPASDNDDTEQTGEDPISKETTSTNTEDETSTGNMDAATKGQPGEHGEVTAGCDEETTQKEPLDEATEAFGREIDETLAGLPRDRLIGLIWRLLELHPRHEVVQEILKERRREVTGIVLRTAR